MIQVPTDAAAMREFRAYLDNHGYNSEQLTARLGRARPPADGEQQQMFDDSRQVTTANALARLFLLGAPVDAATLDEFLDAAFVEFCTGAGLLETRDGATWSNVVIVPVDELLFASDAFRLLGTDRAGEFVLPASTHSANLLRFVTLRDRVGTTLDLGCGCGLQALYAARHSDRVVASDISDAALRYTRFNALLNELDNVECVAGSLFEPFDGRQFDLIVSNPPFVIGPGECFVYRDNPMELDGFCEQLVREAPSHLNPGGHLQMLCEWVEVEGEAWDRRIADWVRGCDAWVLHAPPLAPGAYVARRGSDIAGEGVPSSSPDDWQAYFEQHRVRAVHPGMITLRRREGANWLHIQNLSGDVTAPAGAAVAAGIEAVDFLEDCDDDALLEATLELAAGLTAEEMREDDQVTGVYLRLDNGLHTDAEIDGAVAAFLNLFDGRRSVRDCAAQFAGVADADPESLTRDLLTIVRVFVSRGFLVAAELD